MCVEPELIGWKCLQAQGTRDWALPEGFRIQFEGEQAELFVGGVYVRLFLKNPQFPLRHPKVRPPNVTPHAASHIRGSGDCCSWWLS